MAVWQSIGNGIRTASRKPRMLVDLWLINVIFALLVAGPFFALFKADLGHSMLGRNLRSFDPISLGDFIYKYQDVGPAALALVAGGVLIYMLLYVFLNGGIIGRLLDREEGAAALPLFFADCGRYFWRFARLFLLSLVFYAVALGAIPGALEALLKPVTENARTAWTGFWISNLRTVVTLLLLSLVHMIFDYARIIVVVREERRVLRALGAALGFIGKRFFRSWSLYLLITAGWIAGTAVYLFGRQVMPDTGLLWLGLFLVWEQAFIFFRLWTKMTYFAAQADYYGSRRF